MGRVNYSGFVIAGLGFFLTRFTVTLAIYEDPLRFYFAGVVPLAIGLGLAAFGVGLAVADVDASVVRTTALWCVVGFLAMLVLVVLTLLGSSPGGIGLSTARSQTYLSNFLIGGSVGGTLTGLYAARNRRQRAELRQQTNRLVTLNRLLRHEVLNSVTAIRGWASVDPEENPEAMSVIDERGDDIQGTIEDVKYLIGRSRGDQTTQAPVALDDALADSVAALSDQYPDVDVSLATVPDDVRVLANERLSHVFTQLLENAIVHAEDEDPSVTVEATQTSVSVTIADDGDGLPESQQELLETGDIAEFDNPRKGFGLNVVRLLVESYDGTVETQVDDEGTAVRVVLPRVRPDEAEKQPTRVDLTGVRPALPHLVVSFVASILAGGVYGVVSESMGGSVAAIGVFYGTSSAIVGWLTHEFHSVVFGFVFVGLLSVALERFSNSLRTYLTLGVLWGVALWAFAGGIVASVWLRLLGIPAPIPRLSVDLLVSHVVWGLSLALLTAWGYTYTTPWLARVQDRLGIEA